ncbi:MAG: DUF302 domain-containing protein [Candidatus Thiodiazotropha sp. (ex Epidulcina cf. delphinae)]|nr:DUF302 domain-containing protein [Candidatus Thiodiazotropha sp. (ex Epidulcina cf. delphinae)]
MPLLFVVTLDKGITIACEPRLDQGHSCSPESTLLGRRVNKVHEALMEEHLGIVSDVDVQAIFKNKMGKAIPAYHIFGACNPKLADRVLNSEPNAGTLLPCNFIIRETNDGKVVVSFMDPESVLGLCITEAPKQVGAEAKEKLLRVVEKLRT